MILLIYLSIITILAIYFRIRPKKSYSELSTANLLLYFLPAFVGGDILLGGPKMVFAHGAAYIWVFAGLLVKDSLFIWLLSPRLANYSNCVTVADIAGRVFGAKAQTLCGVLAVLHSTFFLAIQIVALGYIGSFFLNINLTTSLFMSALLIGIMAGVGTLNQLSVHRGIQMILIFMVLPLLFTFAMKLVGGYFGLYSALPEERLAIFPWHPSGRTLEYFHLFWVLVLPDINPLLTQKLMQFGDNTEYPKKILWRMSLGRVVLFLILLCLGMLAYVLEPGLSPDFCLLFLIATILPTGLKTLAIAGLSSILLAASIAYLGSANLLISRNVLPFISARTKHYTFLKAIVILVLLVAALTIAIFKPDPVLLFFIATAIWLPMALSLVFFTSSKDCATTMRRARYPWRIRGVLGNLNIFRGLVNFINWVAASSSARVEVFGAPFGLFVFFGVANFCFVPFIFSDVLGYITPGFTIYLRFLASFISFLLIMKEFWPELSKKFGAFFWHLTLMLCLPHFGIAMCLFSSLSIEWVIDLILITFILGLLVDWKSYIAIMVSAYLLSFLSFWLLGDVSKFSPHVSNLPITIYAMTVAMVAGTIFSRNKEIMLLERLDTFRALGSTIAHEMRTPLSSINISASGLKNCLPALIKTHREAKAAGLKVPHLSQLTLDSMHTAPERMIYVCASALNTIDMLLLQLKDRDWSAHFGQCSMAECVDTALREYSFREGERQLVSCQVTDFNFVGNKYLVVHILYNLLRNALTFIQSERRGTIKIWTSRGRKEMMLHFCDSAKGINKTDLPFIFDHGFSKRSGGSGVGLFYCRRMMTAMKGSINVKSVEGQFAEFILHFSK
jgi:signal transduction histidine kinase/Na+/proline symporter